MRKFLMIAVLACGTIMASTANAFFWGGGWMPWNWFNSGWGYPGYGWGYPGYGYGYPGYGYGYPGYGYAYPGYGYGYGVPAWGGYPYAVAPATTPTTPAAK